MNKRSFKQLNKSISLVEMNNFCKKITQSYATSDAIFARSYYSEHENISKRCFYDVLEYAIVRNLVSDDIVEKVVKKSIINQQRYSKEAGRTTVEHYNRIKKKRIEYIVFSFSDQEIKELAEQFANYPEISKSEFAKNYDVGTRVINILLKKAITEKIIDDDIFMKIKKRSLEKDSSENAKEFFRLLEERRNSKGKETTLH